MLVCTAFATSVAFGRVALGILMCTAGFSKALSARLSDTLGRALRALGLPPVLLPALMVVEMVLGVWLVSGTNAAAAGVLASSLLFIFSVGLILLSRRGYSGSCGCFLGIGNPISRVDLGRNVTLLVLSVAVVAFPSPNRCVAETLETSEFSLWVIAGVITVFSICFLAFLTQVRRILSTGTTRIPS